MLDIGVEYSYHNVGADHLTVEWERGGGGEGRDNPLSYYRNAFWAIGFKDICLSTTLISWESGFLYSILQSKHLHATVTDSPGAVGARR